MFNRNSVTLGILLMLVLSAFYSCQDQTDDFMQVQDANHYVSIEKAKDIAQMLEVTAEAKTEGKERKVKEIRGVPDKNSQDAFYIINYEKGGFVIISADNRVEPILAYSEDNEFPLDAEYFPSGLVGWLYDTKEKIETVRVANETQSEEVAMVWDDCYVRSLMRLPNCPDDGPGGGGCENTYVTKGPLLSTTWGQGCGYNGALPTESDLGCDSGDLSCSHAFTGCVATAMGQVMNYHSSPSSYNWSSMTQWSSNIETLMEDIGDAVDMDYDCDGSGADTEDDVAPAFTNDFGYTSATYANYSHSTVKSQINYSRPVILRGGREGGWWIFNIYRDGHAWVCDGYQSSYYCETGTSYLRLHMNWGWSGSFNGWFSFNNFNPGGFDFNYKRGMVYNIRP